MSPTRSLHVLVEEGNHPLRFKRVTGESPLQYVKKIRLNKARSLLVHEGLAVSSAAYEVGYESPSQFSREFKRYFSVSPSDARASGYAQLVAPEAETLGAS